MKKLNENKFKRQFLMLSYKLNKRNVNKLFKY